MDVNVNADDGRPRQPRVLEAPSHKAPFILEDGQLIGRLIYEPLSEPLAQLYGHEIGSHYQAQAMKLSKHFR